MISRRAVVQAATVSAALSGSQLLGAPAAAGERNATNRATADQRHRNEKLSITLYQYVAITPELHRIEIKRVSDRHFWHEGYDKAKEAPAAA